MSWENGACKGSRISRPGGHLSQLGSSHTPDQLDICFDDTHAIANAGLLLAATLAERLSMEPCRTSRYGRHGSWPGSLVNPSGALSLPAC